ncbi:MAG: Uma2 family endonuclease [Phototrophicaceae bacterium]
MSNLSDFNPRPTEEAFIPFEPHSNARHEVIDNHVITSTGASRHHSLITANLTALLNFALLGQSAEVYTTNMRVKLLAEDAFAYPDVVVCAHDPQFLQGEFADMLLNPSVMIEVISPSTELLDRVTKLAHYRMLDSVQDYLLVAQNMPRIERYSRTQLGWLYVDKMGLDRMVDIPSLDIQLNLADIYAKIQFSGEWWR